MRTDNLLYRLFSERPATLFELAGRTPPADAVYRLHAEEAQVAEAACVLAQEVVAEPEAQRREAIDLIETLLVYKLPHLTRQEIKKMLRLPDPDLRKTRFYQEAYSEGEEDGHRAGELSMVLRLLRRRVGTLGPDQEARVRALSTAELDALGEALLEFGGADDLAAWLRGH